ncbi:M15 family metallopeptidase [uncultured Massilia sp.]|uniref:M15 family metallopeptidase n=1 Tax=uncultured Massilia sp. TaxID=169973 RepID=UPI0025D95DFC|nr:M15 family metallopeptidase [uncultured Massilia sp.]
MDAAFDAYEWTGRARTHVVQYARPRFAARPEVAQAFLALRAAALDDGIDLLPTASWRPFEAQLRIWNRKFSGEATLYDIHGQPRARAGMTDEEVVWGILGWSGFPGATRRHWGTDIDVFDRAALAPGQKVRLLPQEVQPGGVFERLHAWLDVHIGRFGFFRPYRHHRGGMYPEPWHLSYAPSAQAALAAFDLDVLRGVIAGAHDMLGRELALDMLPEIARRHVLDVDPP